MPIDLQEITLSEEQKHYIAEVAQQSGRPWREVLDEQLAIPPNGAKGRDWGWNERYIEDRDQWQAYFREWIAKQTTHNPNFDDSRESIYD